MVSRMKIRGAPPGQEAMSGSVVVGCDGGKACAHPKENTRLVDKNPGADGIEDVRMFEIVCKDCGKVLVQRDECISATTTTVLDKAWGDSNGYIDEMY
ncbi:hypothetical protein QOT17_013214 [Balamuthia mandrillaris]